MCRYLSESETDFLKKTLTVCILLYLLLTLWYFWINLIFFPVTIIAYQFALTFFPWKTVGLQESPLASLFTEGLCVANLRDTALDCLIFDEAWPFEDGLWYYSQLLAGMSSPVPCAVNFRLFTSFFGSFASFEVSLDFFHFASQSAVSFSLARQSASRRLDNCVTGLGYQWIPWRGST